MASVLNGAFGAGVTVTPASGAAAYRIHAVFRREAVEVDGGDGAGVIVTVPTLRVPLTVAALVRGDLVAPDEVPGETFRIVNNEPDPSPAADRFVMYDLEFVP